MRPEPLWILTCAQLGREQTISPIDQMKWVHYRQDAAGLDLDLRFFRDTDGREVDFIVTDRERPVLAVECKFSQSRPDRNLRYWKKRFPECETWLVTAQEGREFVTPDGIRVCHALRFLSRLI